MPATVPILPAQRATRMAIALSRHDPSEPWLQIACRRLALHAQYKVRKRGSTCFVSFSQFLDNFMPTTVPRPRRPLNVTPVISAVLSVCFLCSHTGVRSAPGTEPAESKSAVDLTPQIAAGEQRHIRALFELDGILSLKSDVQDPVKLPVQAKARLIYDEKTLQGPTSATSWPRSTIRHYKTADATIQFRENTVTPSLRENRRLVATSATSADDVVLFSPLGPLSRDELDLIDIPANSAIIEAILPHRRVRVGDSWKLESELLPAILGLDALATQDIECTLDRLDNGAALIQAKGRVSGASGGVSTDMTLAAKYAFDLTQKRLKWFAMSLKENRSIGHAQPGIEATIRIQMAISKRANVPALHPDVVRDLNVTADENARLLEFVSETGGFELLLDRNWHEMLDEKDATVLRLVVRGDLVAQCNLTLLPPMEDGVPFTVSDFQKDIETVLADNFGEFIAVNEDVSDSGLHVMRVVANGVISDVPINWVYCHITNEQGRRVSCVFTFESDLADQFGAADQKLISSFRFRDQVQQ